MLFEVLVKSNLVILYPWSSSKIDELIEFPVTLMDAYLFTHMGINEEGIIPEFKKTLELGRSFSDQNVISVIWDDNVLKMKGGRVYVKILEFLT